jgi:alpha-tubulin suppressor-like RCC1 family protein
VSVRGKKTKRKKMVRVSFDLKFNNRFWSRLLVLFGLTAVVVVVGLAIKTFQSQASEPINITNIKIDSISQQYGLAIGGDNLTLSGDFGEAERTAQIYTEYEFSYIIDTDGQLYAVAHNDNNVSDCEMLGIGLDDGAGCDNLGIVNIGQTAAGAINANTKIRKVAPNYGSVLAIDEAGQLYQWGSNVGDSGAIAAPVNLSAIGFGAIDANTVLVDIINDDNDYYAIDDREHVYEWYGSDAPVDINLLAAGDITTSTHIKQITTDQNSVIFAVDDNGQVYVWGGNGYGVLGLGAPCTAFNGSGEIYTDQTDCVNAGGVWTEANNIEDVLAPINLSQRAAGAINTNTHIVQLSANGWDSVIALDSDGQVYTWGTNAYNNLGVGPLSGYCVDTLDNVIEADTKVNCESSGVWHGEDYGICSDAQYYTQATCVAASETWTQGYGICSVELTPYQYSNQADCNQAGGAWSAAELCQLVSGAVLYSYTDQTGCQAAIGVWYDAVPDAWAPVNVGAAAKGGFDSSTKIVKIGGSFSNNWAIDSAGQLYIWGNAISGLVDWYCEGFKGYYNDYWSCEDAGSSWSVNDMSGNVISSAPYNVSAFGLGDIVPNTKFGKVIESRSGESTVDILIDNDGHSYSVGGADYTDELVSSCTINETIRDETDCETAGGEWRRRYPDSTFPLNLNYGYGDIGASTQLVTGSAVCGEGCRYALIDTDGEVLVLKDSSSGNRLPTDVGQIASVVSETEFEISLGGTDCQNVTMVDHHTLTCVTAAHSAGLVRVSVSNGDITALLPATCAVASASACNGQLDSGEARHGDRANVVSGFLYEEVYIDLNLDTNIVQIGGLNGLTPTITGSFASASNSLTASTNNPKGYTLKLSTNQPSSNPHASDMVHQSITNTYLSITTNSCTWDTNSKTLTNTNNALATNTYGFTINSGSLSAQKLCQVPNSTNPLTVKSATTANETGDSTTFYYGTKIDTAQLAGNYQTKLIYEVLGNI